MIFDSQNTLMSASDKAGQCLDCHASEETDFDHRAGTHMKGAVDCSSRHRVHDASGRDRLWPVHRLMHVSVAIWKYGPSLASTSDIVCSKGWWPVPIVTSSMAVALAFEFKPRAFLNLQSVRVLERSQSE